MSIDRFDRLFEAHAEPLFAFLLYRVGDRALAEDLVSETFERVLRARRRYDPRRGSEKTWIYTTALNLLRDHARREHAERRAVERGGATMAHVPSGAAFERSFEERDAVGAAVARLPRAERDAIALRYGADLTMPEVANVLGEKLTTVEARVYRALVKLREELER
jgi:RNA polymerase sigma-70 factor (ECF subfamily)